MQGYRVLTMGDLETSYPSQVQPRQRRQEMGRGGYENEMNAYPRPVGFDLPDTDDLAGCMGDTLFSSDAADQVTALAAQLAASGDPSAASATAASQILQNAANLFAPDSGAADQPPPQVGVPGQSTTQRAVDAGEQQFGKQGSTGAPPIATAVNTGVDLVTNTVSRVSSSALSFLDGDFFGVPKKVIAGVAGLVAAAVVIKKVKKSKKGRRR